MHPARNFIPRDPYHNFPLQNAWHHHWFIHNWFCLICYRGKVLGNLVHIWAVSVCVDHVSTCLCMCAYACVPIRKVLRSQHHRNLHPDWSLVQLLALQCRIVADGVVVDYNAKDIFGAIIIVLVCYFAWDLAYPRCYQILSFLHGHVLGESTNVRKCTNFVKVEKILSSI